jgi:hypothetical protein
MSTISTSLFRFTILFLAGMLKHWMPSCSPQSTDGFIWQSIIDTSASMQSDNRQTPFFLYVGSKRQHFWPKEKAFKLTLPK